MEVCKQKEKNPDREQQRASRGGKPRAARSSFMASPPAAVSRDTTSAWIASTSAASPCREHFRGPNVELQIIGQSAKQPEPHCTEIFSPTKAYESLALTGTCSPP